jgi:hypothetical protein
MRIRILVLASMAAMSLAGAVWAQSARDTAGDYFVAAAMSTPHDSVLIAGESRGQAGHAFLLPNNGAASAFVVGCEEACTGVQADLRAAGLGPISASSSSANTHVAVLHIPSNYARTLSNLEVRIVLSCPRPQGCYYRWALLGAGPVPTLAQRGMRAAPTDQEWAAAAPPAGALHWVSRPNGDDLRFFYPMQAYANNRSGSAQLQCLVAADGALRCRARNEAPAGAGFGDAARRLSTMLRVEPTDATGQSTANRQVVIPVQFSRTS